MSAFTRGKKVSRRELIRQAQRAHQAAVTLDGARAQALQTLVALVIQNDGALTVKRENLTLVTSDMNLQVTVDPETGDVTFKVQETNEDGTTHIYEPAPASDEAVAEPAAV
jgi:hypothetical protein